MRTLILLSAVATLAGCGVSKKNFAGNLLEVTCARMEECQQGAFELLYTSVDDCIARQEDLANSLTDCVAGHCEFDKANAKQCLDEVKGADCGDIEDGTAYADCADVWSECDGKEADCIDGGTQTDVVDDTAGM